MNLSSFTVILNENEPNDVYISANVQHPTHFIKLYSFLPFFSLKDLENIHIYVCVLCIVYIYWCVYFYISACDLAKEQKRNFGDDIALQLRAARRKRWNVQEDRRLMQEIELKTYLDKLIQEDMENRLAKLKMDDTKNEELIKAESSEIEQECVRYNFWSS